MATILYVDDEQAISRAVRAWLSRRGHEVHLAKSVESAVRCLAKHRLDGVFLDVWLPDGTGFDLYERLRDRDPALAARTVFITGDVVPERETNARLESLGRPILPKPFNLSDLDTWVEVWTATRRDPASTQPGDDASRGDGDEPPRLSP